MEYQAPAPAAASSAPSARSKTSNLLQPHKRAKPRCISVFLACTLLWSHGLWQHTLPATNVTFNVGRLHEHGLSFSLLPITCHLV
ncbi:hypothetical protein T440DRAFT_464410 [Plenodomus tracheiphilus IPT5]|uniref:Uncharacterized protein n=1 Tax=Plenodomus tracheiphilus IPT5 TaxID=1408161 RepID=A0A6A7BI97_9PLEO|nr:hypothetical protein T440DRAFT_464410 [Plenodomus tracheiphilus IPT5]